MFVQGVSGEKPQGCPALEDDVRYRGWSGDQDQSVRRGNGHEPREHGTEIIKMFDDCRHDHQVEQRAVPVEALYALASELNVVPLETPPVAIDLLFFVIDAQVKCESGQAGE